MSPNDRLTGWLAVVVALGYLVLGITHFAMPREQLHFATGVSPAFFQSLAEGHAAFTLHYWSFALTSLLAMGVVLGLRPEPAGPPPLALRLARAWALLVLALSAVDFLRLHTRALALAERFATLTPTAQEALVAAGLGRLDPSGFLFALGGVWVVLINRAMWQSPLWPRWLAGLGAAAGVAQVAVFPASVLHLPLVVDLAVGLGGVVLGPLWYLGVGLRLQRASNAAVQQAAAADERRAHG